MSGRCIYQTLAVNGRFVKVYSPNECGEYVCRLYVPTRREYGDTMLIPMLRAEADYFTNDRDDAINSAHHMTKGITK